MSYPSEVLADSPLGYYRLNETSGTSATDLTANANTGTYTGTFTLGAAGPLVGDPASKALDLTGCSASVNGYVSCPDIAATRLTGTTMTLECWFKQPGSFISFCAAMWRSNVAGSINGIINFDNAGKALANYHTSGGSAAPASTTDIRADSLWHHCAAIYDGSNAIMYLDGVSQASAALTGTLASPSGTPFILGAIPSTTGFNWTGYLAECAIYGTALSATRILAHYNAAVNPNVPVPRAVGFSSRSSVR